MVTLQGIIASYGPGLARVAASYEADRALQEDLLQEILLAIHGALPGLRDESKLAAFVFRIAHNRAVTHIVRRTGERRGDRSQIPHDGTDTPESHVLADERTRRLLGAVRRLPLTYRQVVTLVLEDLSYAEIAEALGISQGNVGVRVTRAKAMLREMLDDK